MEIDEKMSQPPWKSMKIYENRSYVLVCPCFLEVDLDFADQEHIDKPFQSYIGIGQNLLFWGTIRVL